MTDEIWKPVILDNVDTGWKVSNMGRVEDRRKRIKIPPPGLDGYCTININRKTFKVHIIVCKLFRGEPPTSLHTQVHHVNSIKHDNRIENLIWKTPSENVLATFENENRKIGGKKQSKSIIGRKVDTNEKWIEYESISLASRLLNLHVAGISKVLRNKAKKIHGYEFKYKNIEKNENEIWKTLKYKGKVYEKYKVSNLNRYETSRGVINEPTPRFNGYCDMRIQINGKGKNIQFSHAVCETFNGSPPSDNHNEVDHIDMNPSNNCPENLEWVTREENIQRSYQKNKNRKSLLEQSGIKIQGRKYRSNDPWINFSSMQEAEKLLDIGKRTHISCVINGKRKQTGGYEFRRLQN